MVHFQLMALLDKNLKYEPSRLQSYQKGCKPCIAKWTKVTVAYSPSQLSTKTTPHDRHPIKKDANLASMSE